MDEQTKAENEKEVVDEHGVFDPAVGAEEAGVRGIQNEKADESAVTDGIEERAEDLDEEPDLETGEEPDLENREDLELFEEDGEELDEDAFFDEEEEEMNEEERELKRKKSKKAVWITLGVLTGMAAAVYLGFSVYFNSHFYFGTRINGVNFSAKDVETVESYMERQVADYHLEMMKSDGGMERIQGSDISLSYEKGRGLDRLLEGQNPLLWITAFWETPEITAPVGVKYDEAKLEAVIQNLDCMQPDRQIPPENAKPEFNGTEFVVKPEVIGSTVNVEVFNKKIREALDEFQEVLDLTEAGCYTAPVFTQESPEVAAACDAMNQYLGASITYTFGSANEVVDRNLISQWMTVDEHMAVIFNQDAVWQYISELAGKYDTYRKQRTFTSGNGNSVVVEGGNYGWQIDQEAECQALTASITSGEVVTKEPAYLRTAAAHDGADWGNTYVEVDLTNQMAYLFVNGGVVVSGPIVTGKPSTGAATPQGVYSIKYCQRNARLRGPMLPDGNFEWDSPVSFWMPFNGGIGLHDAPWQSAFGGDRYLTHGSHGCVNLQYSVAETIFNNVSAGTPVVCHY